MKKTQAEKKYLKQIEKLKGKRFEKDRVPITVVCLHGVMWREVYLSFC